MRFSPQRDPELRESNKYDEKVEQHSFQYAVLHACGLLLPLVGVIATAALLLLRKYGFLRVSRALPLSLQKRSNCLHKHHLKHVLTKQDSQSINQEHMGVRVINRHC